MAADTRNRMIDAALRLLATKGLQGASLADILELAGAPRGSVYHHFPGGKDQLIAEAIERAGGRALTLLDGLDGTAPTEVAALFLESWRELLTRTEFRAGCSVLAVTIAADSPELLGHAGAVFDQWTRRLAELFRAGGLEPDDAEEAASTLIALSEGAVVMCRASRSLRSLDLAERRFLALLENASTS